jgi:hypothetical protein
VAEGPPIGGAVLAIEIYVRWDGRIVFESGGAILYSDMSTHNPGTESQPQKIEYWENIVPAEMVRITLKYLGVD